MTGVASPAPAFARIIDTVSALPQTVLQAMRDDPVTPINGIAIYLGESDAAAKRDAAFALGLFVVPVSFSRTPHWDVSQCSGDEDGAQDVAHAVSLGIPGRVHLHTDFEEPLGDAATCISYLNTRGTRQQNAGYGAGLYVGDGQPCNGQQLGLLVQSSYWKALSRLALPGTPPGMVVEPTPGWCIEQLAHTVNFHGVSVDFDVIHYDWKGRTPMVWAPS